MAQYIHDREPIMAGGAPTVRCPTQVAIEWLPGPVCANACTAEGLGVSGGQAGSGADLARFTICPKDAFGNLLGSAHDCIFTVRLSGGSDKSGARNNPIRMVTTEDGNVICTYTAAISGRYNLSVLLGKQHISGSPFNVGFTEGRFTDEALAAVMLRTSRSKSSTRRTPSTGQRR